jgi:hypothetical protein
VFQTRPCWKNICQESTAVVLGINVNMERFLKKKKLLRSLPTKMNLHQLCRCKKADCANSTTFVCRNNGKLCITKCRGGRGENTLCTLCDMRE